SRASRASVSRVDSGVAVALVWSGLASPTSIAIEPAVASGARSTHGRPPCAPPDATAIPGGWVAARRGTPWGWQPFAMIVLAAHTQTTELLGFGIPGRDTGRTGAVPTRGSTCQPRGFAAARAHRRPGCSRNSTHQP